MRTIVMLVVVLLVGCGAAEGQSYDGGPVLGGEAGALVAPDETGGASSSTGGADASGGVLVSTGGLVVTGGSSSGGTGGDQQATGGATLTGGASSGGAATGGSTATGGGPACDWATVDNCAVATNSEMLNYFADADCSVQLFPSPKQLVSQGLVGCQRELVPGQGIQAVEAWKLGSFFGGSSWWRLTDEGCELTTVNVPAQYGYPYFYMGESVSLEQATRQVWTCK